MIGTIQSAPKRAFSVALLWVGLAVGLTSAALAAGPAGATLQSVSPGVQIDWSRSVMVATASCAADLFAPSAEIARLKAERLARMRAEQRLRKALQLLSREPRFHGKVAADILAQLDPAQAQVAHIEYAATGSISLRLELSLLAPAKAPASAPPASPPDSGAAGGADGEKSPRNDPP